MLVDQTIEVTEHPCRNVIYTLAGKGIARTAVFVFYTSRAYMEHRGFFIASLDVREMFEIDSPHIDIEPAPSIAHPCTMHAS